MIRKLVFTAVIIFVTMTLFVYCDMSASNPVKNSGNGQDKGDGKNIGYNMTGELVECALIDTTEMICTLSFGPGDSFKNACEAAGFSALMCGCHSYLCSQKIEFKLENN